MKFHCMALASCLIAACGSSSSLNTPSASSNSCSYTVARQDPNGWLLTRPEVHLNFWGDWKSSYNTPANFEAAWSVLLNNGTVLQRLSEYGIHEGTCDSNYYLTAGSNTYVNDSGSSNDAGNNALDDSTFGDTINAEIRLNQLPYPNDNTLYLIFLEPGDTSESIVTHGWGGYHAHYSYGTQRYAYAILKYAGDNNTVVTTSHEIYEAATNPGGNSGYWDVPSGEEVGDLCQGNNESIYGNVIQTVWSQQLCQCQ